MIFPSKAEGFSLVIIEAMAAGVPVLHVIGAAAEGCVQIGGILLRGGSKGRGSHHGCWDDMSHGCSVRHSLFVQRLITAGE